MTQGNRWYDDIPNEYQDGTIDEEDALAHAFSIEYIIEREEQPDYMNDDEAYYHQCSDLDPLEQMIADEEAEEDE